MSHETPENGQLPAPCIVDNGIVVNKQDMHRLLCDLSQVRYRYIQDGELGSESEGYVMEVFSDPQRATLVANHGLYLNVCSFDYLELKRNENHQACFHLVQEGRQLQLVPLTNPLHEQTRRPIDPATLEAVVTEVLSAGWDMRLDEDDNFSI